MPGVQTYTLIDQTTLTTSAASVTFSSIPQIYEDLVLEIIAAGTTSISFTITVNGDTGTNYSRTYVGGNGSSAYSGRNSNNAPIGSGDVTTTLGSTFTNVQFMSYSNTNVNKNWLISMNNAGSFTEANVVLWRSTAAITSVVLTLLSGSFVSGSTFRLYGLVA